MAFEQNRRCPQCGYEYQSWVEVCPDCGTLLETRPSLEVIKGKTEENRDPRWTVVTNVPNAIMGNFIKSQLEDAGIPVLMFRSPSADVAQFSHNDFVPQDLMVPQDRVRDARSLIDSAPGNSYGPYPLDQFDYDEDDDDDEDDEAVEQEAPDEGELTDLPAGWSMLPSEADIDARQHVRRSHGQVLKGWYWSDGKPTREAAWDDDEEGEEDEEDEEDEDPDRKPLELPLGDFGYSPRYSDPYGGYSGRDWSSPSKWIRIIYGILLLAMSLPFLLSLLERIWETMRSLP